MSTPARRTSSPLTRRQREARAYRLTLAAGATGIATFAAVILAIVGAISFGWVILLAVITVALALALRSTVT